MEALIRRCICGGVAGIEGVFVGGRTAAPLPGGEVTRILGTSAREAVRASGSVDKCPHLRVTGRAVITADACPVQQVPVIAWSSIGTVEVVVRCVAFDLHQHG